jgi:hypothetical protein
MGAPKGHKKYGGGRAKGTPNKVTADARAAIAQFVDDNAHRLQKWLDEIADGKQDDEGKYIIEPDPEKAFSLFQSVIEYHVPKLARTEHTGEVKNQVTLTLGSADAKL